MATFDDKTTVRNYALAFFLALNLFRAGGYVVNGTFTPAILEMMLWSGPVPGRGPVVRQSPALPGE
ncbi:MAG: hypothetical protein MZV65_14775 [Chromatiales bacterium]|nr:hypothetical protein [Chromatiales bacterium]